MIEPSEVYFAAMKREKQNIRFRIYLKNNADPDELDRQFKDLHDELFLGYDCRACANCCRVFYITLEENEVDSIADFLGVTRQDIVKRLHARSDGGYGVKPPCCFLGADGNCAIYERRPLVCRDYPHTDKPERLYRLINTLATAEQCPIVYEIIERLKTMYRFEEAQ